MGLSRISLENFRNHAATTLGETAHFNLLVGENGAGKTNLLEALSLLGPGRGLRRANLGDLAGRAVPGATPLPFAIGASLTEAGTVSARIGTHTEPGQPGRRLVRVNGAPASAASLAEWLALSWLTPAMDGLLETARRERGKLLEKRGDPRWLDAVEAQAADHGAAVARTRADLVLRLADELSALPPEPFARPTLTYRPGGPLDATELRAELARGRPRDRAAGRALMGAQRDELLVEMASTRQPGAACSTGEQKAMLIAITLAHGILAAAGRPSVLLLDEVAAHLDPLRRTELFNRLRAGKAQVWMTGTELAPFAAIRAESAIWRVSGGGVERV